MTKVTLKNLTKFLILSETNRIRVPEGLYTKNKNYTKEKVSPKVTTFPVKQLTPLFDREYRVQVVYSHSLVSLLYDLVRIGII